MFVKKSRGYLRFNKDFGIKLKFEILIVYDLYSGFYLIVSMYIIVRIDCLSLGLLFGFCFLYVCVFYFCVLGLG